MSPFSCNIGHSVTAAPLLVVVMVHSVDEIVSVGRRAIIGLYNIGDVILAWFIYHKGMGCNRNSTANWCLF